MKKLLYILAVSVLASCAFADFTATDWVWDAPYTDDYFVTDYAPAGFAVESSYYNPDPGSFGFHFYSDNVSGWLYNGNDSFTVTFEGFLDRDFDPSYGALIVYVDDGFRNAVCYMVPWSGNGAYTFTAEDIVPGWNTGDSIEGLEVGCVEVFLEHVKWTPRTYGRVTVALNTPEEETEVPEPATAAYALMGLGSLAGIKRRIKK